MNTIIVCALSLSGECGCVRLWSITYIVPKDIMVLLYIKKAWGLGKIKKVVQLWSPHPKYADYTFPISTCNKQKIKKKNPKALKVPSTSKVVFANKF